MRPSSSLQHAVHGAIDRVAALLGSTEPLHWLTMTERSSRRRRSEPGVTLTEVTDPAVKHQVLIACAAEKRKAPASAKNKRREPESFLVTLGIAPDDTPEGLAAAVPHVAVLEVTPTPAEINPILSNGP